MNKVNRPREPKIKTKINCDLKRKNGHIGWPGIINKQRCIIEW